MTKKEYHKQINARFYAYIENNFPEYTIDSNEGYGRIYLISEDIDNTIEYHQSRHDVHCWNFSSDKIKSDTKKMEDYINNNIIPLVNLNKDLAS